MKKSIKLFAAAFAIVAAASCVKDSSTELKTPAAAGEGFTFTASLGSDTKMTVDAEGKCAWSVGDIIVVYNGNNSENVTRTVVDGADTFVNENIEVINVTAEMLSADKKSVKITTTLAEPTGSNWYFYAMSKLTNIYMVRSNGNVIAGAVDVTDQSAMPFTASAICAKTANTLQFRHALAYLKMAGSAWIYKVVVRSNNADAIQKSSDIDASNGSTTVRAEKKDNIYTASVNAVAVNAPFYVALAPFTWSEGFSVDIYYGANFKADWEAQTPTKTLNYAKSFTTVAGHVYNMGDILAESAKTPVESVTAAYAKYLTAVGKTINLEGRYTVLPADATNKKVVFSSSNASIASVSAEGVVTAKALGDAVITIAAADDEAKKVEITVRVVADIPEFAAVTKGTPVTIHNCDNLKYMTKLGSKSTAVVSNENPKEGTGFFYNESEKQSSEWMAFKIDDSAVDGKILGANRAHLTFWFYIDPFRFLKGDGVTWTTMTERLNKGKGHIELTSIGNNTVGVYWTTTEALRGNAFQENGTYGNIANGWNFIDLPFKDACHDLGTTDDNKGYINTKGINYFRFYIDGPACLYDIYKFGFDDIAIYEDYTQETTAEKKYLHNLENLSGFTGAYYNVEEQAVGNKYPGGRVDVFQVKLSEPVASGTTKRNGHIHFKMYVSDVTAFSGSGQFELTSSGTCDKEEISWGVGDVAKCLHNGWNDVVLDFNRSNWSAEFNPNNINWFRLYDNYNKAVTIQIKDIYVFEETFAK